MACQLIAKGRTLACKDNRTGIKLIDFANFDSSNVYSVTGQEVGTLPVGLTEVFRYEVKGTGNELVETATVDLEKRTTEIKQVLNLVLPKLTKESEVELLALTYGTITAFVHDYKGNVFVVGTDTGLDATSTIKSTTDGGYKITLEATDVVFSPFLSSSAKTALNALVSTDNVTP
jgi:hypothetical protein